MYPLQSSPQCSPTDGQPVLGRGGQDSSTTGLSKDRGRNSAGFVSNYSSMCLVVSSGSLGCAGLTAKITITGRHTAGWGHDAATIRGPGPGPGTRVTAMENPENYRKVKSQILKTLSALQIRVYEFYCSQKNHVIPVISMSSRLTNPKSLNPPRSGLRFLPSFWN